ncbi:hypothetical protein AAG906_020680 [Vitis piasezkii]
MPKDLCTEPVGEAMGAIPWLDETLDMQSTQNRWNSHGRNAMARCYGSVARQGGLRQRTRLVVRGMGKERGTLLGRLINSSVRNGLKNQQLTNGSKLINATHEMTTDRLSNRELIGLLELRKCWENGKEKVVGLKVDIQSLMDEFKCTLQSNGEDITVLKKAMLQESFSGSEAPPKIRVPKTKGFNGNRNPKELKNFL